MRHLTSIPENNSLGPLITTLIDKDFGSFGNIAYSLDANTVADNLELRIFDTAVPFPNTVDVPSPIGKPSVFRIDTFAHVRAILVVTFDLQHIGAFFVECATSSDLVAEKRASCKISIGKGPESRTRNRGFLNHNLWIKQTTTQSR